MHRDFYFGKESTTIGWYCPECPSNTIYDIFEVQKNNNTRNRLNYTMETLITIPTKLIDDGEVGISVEVRGEKLMLEVITLDGNEGNFFSSSVLKSFGVYKLSYVS